jgi:hypothetical protein
MSFDMLNNGYPKRCKVKDNEHSVIGTPDKLEQQVPGTKYDKDKLQYSLIPPYALEQVAKVLTEGLKKYKERDNWQKVPDAKQRYTDAMLRHIQAVLKGEMFDTDSTDPTIPHLAAVAVNALFLLELAYNPKLKDNTSSKQ